MSDNDNTEEQEDLNTYPQSDSDDSEEQESPEQVRIQNIQKEFERKLKTSTDTTNRQLETLAQSQAELLRQLQGFQNSVQSEASDTELEDLMYSDPKAYATRLKDQAKNEALREFQQTTQAATAKTQALQGAINDAISQFPELSKTEHPMTQRVYDIVGSDASKIDPRDLKLAILQVATDMNIAPISKRTKKMSDDDFTGLSSKGQKSKATKRAGANIPEGTKAWAIALGLDLRDPVVQKRLEARSKRDWMTPKSINRDLNEDLEK